jgi:transposase
MATASDGHMGSIHSGSSRRLHQLGNYATHKHPKVRAWLARRPRWHIHFTPTYASWLNQVERFFALITQRAIRRGSFESTADLIKKIDRFIRAHNENAHPFVDCLS